MSPTRRLAVGVRALAAVLSVLVLAGSGWGWYLAKVAEASLSRTDAIPTDGNVDAQGNGGEAMNLLLVGRDSRAGLTPEQQEEYVTGDPTGLLNTDTMMLVHVPADGSAASFVSLPRDLYVPIPGNGKGKLNSAYGDGYNAAQGEDSDRDSAGAQSLIRTVSQFSGLRIDHYAEINLLGFINLSTIVGGVDVNICKAVDDSVTGAHFDAGPQTLSGSQALLFVRQRHGLPSELDRQRRQQVYLAGMLRNLLSKNLLLDPAKQQAIVKQVGSSVTFDKGLDVFDLAAQLQSVKPGNITFQTLPGLKDDKVDGSDVLVPSDPAALTTFFASLSADPAEAPAPEPPAPVAAAAPADVTVSVFNGSGVKGAAATAATALGTAGFVASSGGNAPANTDRTTIAAAPGDEAKAAAVAAQVPGAAVTVDAAVPAGTVQLTLGKDFQAVGQAVDAPAPAPAPAGTYATTERTAEDTSCII
ncbi:LCP family protein [Modestobacter sp. L9-4]|uniref:LCP family protein n=1 Tax=Modestobacter sp. L9-4 TaxID=2851567 RepID=UPI001F45AF51|nr:LCP family protein [Modestobacter sp. L9-4]